MADIFQLTLFPPGGLQSSIITTVWVGVCVIVFLNARFGTTLAGLVVPGYLVPLFFVKPASAIVVVIEAYITYGLALLLANKVLVRFGYAEMFGRDRFFALVLLSVLVRLLLDVVVIPILISQYGGWFSGMDLTNNLQSFGLIIVALIANQMWMGGVVRGSKALWLYVGLTYLIIAWLLIPLTNFNIGGLTYMYEDLATSLLSSPKAYIILLTTAFLASRLNLKFGWEFNGILIPALLALQWYQPEKLLFTFVEGGVILFLGVLIMRTPLLKGMTFEGGRLILLFFNIGFLYKIVLGFALYEYFPSVKISDYYGFGYVVSTLIAVKVYQKKIAAKMAASTLFTSFAGIAIATLVGYFLTLMSKPESIATKPVASAFRLTEQSISSIYESIRPDAFYSAPEIENETESDRQLFASIIEKVSTLTAQNVESAIPELTRNASQIDMDIWLTQTNILAMYKFGVGFYAVNLAPQSQLVIEATRARVELGSDALALAMFERLNNRAILIDLSYQLKSSGYYVFDADAPQGFFQIAHEALSNHNVLQVVGDLKLAEQRKAIRGQGATVQNTLSLLRSPPEDLPLSLIEEMTSNVVMQWQEQAINPQWRHDRFGIATLSLNNREMRTALARLEVLGDQTGDEQVDFIEGYLVSWLMERKQSIAQKGSNAYRVPTENEMLFWHQDVLIPFMSWLKAFDREGWSDSVKDELQRLNGLVMSLGFEFKRLRQPLSEREFIVLQERASASVSYPRKNWASLVVNLRPDNNYLLQVPNPFYERVSFEFAGAFFNKTRSRFLLLSGAHPWANSDGTSNVSLAGNRYSLYHTMFMAITKEFTQPGILPVQIRGFSLTEARPVANELALISLFQNINHRALDTQTLDIISQVKELGLSVRFVDGDQLTSTLYVSNNQQMSYMDFVEGEQFITVWVSPLARDSFKATEREKIEEQHARLLDMPVYRRDILSFPLASSTVKPLPSELKRTLENYAQSRDIRLLQHANSLTESVKLAYLLERSSLQQFVLIMNEKDQVVAAINLNSLSENRVTASHQDSLLEFVESRALWFEAEIQQGQD